jgi:hypothetical protein
MGIQSAYDELMNYVDKNNLQRITNVYNVHVNDNSTASGETPIFDVYRACSKSS